MLAGLILAACQEAGKGTASKPLPEAAPAEALTARRLSLTPGTLMEARLGDGQVHDYLFDLSAGQFVDLVVDQQGLDVAVVLYGPDGQRLTRVDNANGAHGPEPVPLVVDAPGRHRLEIRPSGPRMGSSRYAVRIGAVRPALCGDRTLVAAERLFAEAEYLRFHENQGSLREAIAKSQEALLAFRRLGAHGREADVLFSLAHARFALGETAASLALHLEALALFRRQGREREVGDLLNSLGRVHRVLGRPQEAISCYREARQIHRRLGDREQETTSLNNLGKIYSLLGRMDEALTSYEQALALARRSGDRSTEAVALANLGDLYRLLGDPDKALDELAQALPLLEAEGALREVASVLNAIALAERARGEPRRGFEPLRRALRIQRQLGDRSGEALTLNDLGLLQVTGGELRQAHQSFSAALTLFRSLGDRTSEATALHNLAILEEQLGNRPAAIASYHQALRLFTEVGDRNDEATALFGLAHAQRGAGSLDAAREAMEAAIDRIESLRTEPASHRLRASYFASRQDPYTFYIDLLMELRRRDPAGGHDARALAVSEEARARGLLDLLAESGADLRRDADPGLLAREAELEQDLRAADRQRRRAVAVGSAADRLAADREIRRLLAEHDRVQAAIRRTSPRYAALTHPQPLDLQGIQRRVVDRETLLLEYHLGRQRSFLWVVSPDDLASFELPGREILEEAARRAASLLAAGSTTLARGQTRMALEELSRLVLQPAAPLLRGRRLLIVPDGALHYVPFAALPDPAADGGPPLIERHEVVTLHSASSLATLRSETSGRPPAPGTLALLADPVFDASDPRVAAAARSKSRPGRFGRLPFSRAEAEAILALVPAGESLRALDFGASRELVLDGRLSRYRIVHLATHGILDSDHPELSGLAFSMVDERGRAREGFVHAQEIYRLRLPADLVVLSACRTALGREIRGEGMVGLTQGFLYAGARSVLVSLWEVEDEATAELMLRFYREMLLHGKTPAAALRSAQASLWRETHWQSPQDWAGFVLLGDWRSGSR